MYGTTSCDPMNIPIDACPARLRYTISQRPVKLVLASDIRTRLIWLRRLHVINSVKPPPPLDSAALQKHQKRSVRKYISVPAICTDLQTSVLACVCPPRIDVQHHVPAYHMAAYINWDEKSRFTTNSTPFSHHSILASPLSECTKQKRNSINAFLSGRPTNLTRYMPSPRVMP